MIGEIEVEITPETDKTVNSENLPMPILSEKDLFF